MRRVLPAIALAALIAATLIAPASAAPHCPPGREPEFVFGFAHLKSLLGDKMGDPIECEHANPENGDTLQNTTTGLAFYRKSTNTPTFTNGWDHWAWTIEGLVYWTGSAVDPPGAAAPVSPTESEPSSDPPTSQPEEVDREVIVFSSDRDTVGEVRYGDIYLINADGTGLQRLTTHPKGDSSPALSPDGSKIAFISNRDSVNGDLYIINVDGSDIRRLTTNIEVYDGRAAWSRDGLQIAFEAQSDIFVIGADGTNLTRLTHNQADDNSPTWSLDGRWIAFVSDRDQNYGIHIMSSEGEDISQERITVDPGWETSPAWSPDGARIAFAKKAARACETTHIYTMNVHGGDQHALTGSIDSAQDCTESLAYFDYPTWSPDGGRIAFSGSGGGIFIINADGSDMTILTTHDGDTQPSWGTIRGATQPSAQLKLPPQPRHDGAIAAGLEILEAREDQVPGLAEVSMTLREMRDRISFSVLSENELGRYVAKTRSITLNSALSDEPAAVVAVVLAHEGQHALDHNLGRIPGKPLACFDSEVRAFDVQIALWQMVWGSDGMPNPVSTFEYDFNRMLEIKQESPITHVNTLVELYGDQCGDILNAQPSPSSDQDLRTG